MVKKTLAFLVLGCIFGLPLFGQTSFARGEELFLQNKPQEALVFLEAAAAEDPANVTAALYLGIAYQQLDRVDEAIAVFRKILPRAGTKTALIAYNLGNAYFSKGSASFAEQYYTQAIEADPAFASAYLNRANTRVRTGALNDAIPDYEHFLSLEPTSPKRPEIEQLVGFIRAEFAAEEQRQIIAEAQAKAEAERRRQLLEEVSASLQAAAEETKGLSAGTEDVLGYEGEFELE
ncbi:tetratricopeptide repeat protein [Breznakiella homolactica]|uniref:Tetratricopeptide repeat protein n=1 Tax=Breznakiella homolactica TaxID=2798577 RepID=A0A7T8BAW2_9SPIR|nr:tetratricopeptide repeat protein [Breznakiella homolactica]QQO08583.1 tetratricopeptide repeat protein [Breznakiella homolactica]